jgi:hypothetical protein
MPASRRVLAARPAQLGRIVSSTGRRWFGDCQAACIAVNADERVRGFNWRKRQLAESTFRFWRLERFQHQPRNFRACRFRQLPTVGGCLDHLANGLNPEPDAALLSIFTGLRLFTSNELDAESICIPEEISLVATLFGDLAAEGAEAAAGSVTEADAGCSTGGRLQPT